MSTSGRSLRELLVVDLRRELGQRELDVSGTKAALVERLRKALIDANEDPDVWQQTDSATALDTKSVASDDISKKTSSCDEPADPKVIDGDDNAKEKREEFSENNPSSESDDGSKKLTKTADEGENSGVVGVKEDAALSKNKVDAKSCDKPTVMVNVEASGKEGECLAGINEDDGARDETKACSRASSPANDCSLVVGTAGGTSDLDRELSSFSEAKQQPSQSKVSCTRAPNPSERKGDQEIAQLSVSGKTGDNIKSRTIWVNNVSSSTKAISLKALFIKFGKVLVARIVRKTQNGGSKLCGYVEMSNMEEANKAICALHKTTLDQNLIFCVRGDNKRTEEIIADGRKAVSKPKLPAVSKLAVTNSKIKLISSGRVSTVNDPLRKTHRSDSQFRRDSAALERKSQVAERRVQRAIVMEHQLRRREQEVRRNEAKMIELERQLQAKMKELEVEKEVLRDARGRLSRDQSTQAAKEAELREYEMRLVKAEEQLRISQEQQQKYYESQRIRQQKMAAYDDELRKRRQDLNQQQQRLARRSASGHAVGAAQPFPRRRMPVQASAGQREPSPATRQFRREPAVDSDGRYWASAGPGDRRTGGRYWQDPASASPAVATRGWQDVARGVRDGNHTGYPAANSATPTAMSRTSGRPDFTPPSRLEYSESAESAPPHKRMKKSFDYRRTRYEPPIGGGPELSQNAVQSTGGLPASRAVHHGVQQEMGQEYQPNWRQTNSPVLRQMPQAGGPYGAGRVASSEVQRRYGQVNERFDAYRSMVGPGKPCPGNTATVLSALTASSRGPYPVQGGSFPAGNARQRF